MAQPHDPAGIQSLRLAIDAFVAERDWQQFHTPKNLSMALAADAAELMELFQWSDLSGEGERQPTCRPATRRNSPGAQQMCGSGRGLAAA